MAGGSAQKVYIPREEVSSQNISLEALMLNVVVDSYEGCDVEIFDVPGLYLNADIPDEKYGRLKL